MSTLLLKWANLMEENKYDFTIDISKNVIISFISTEQALLRCMFLIKEKEKQIILIICYQQRCPKPYRKTMIEILDQINRTLSLGFFTMDMNDGELRFRHSVDIEGIEITSKFVYNFIHGAVAISDINYLALNDGLHGKSVPKALSSIKYP